MMTRTLLLGALLWPLLGTACDDGAGPTATTPGATTCGGVTCATGQYCEDPVLNMCTNGCLTDSNCASNQTCVKAAGEDEGTCQNNAQPPPPTGTTCETVCQKLMACDASITQAVCDQTCAGLNDTCKTCIAGENCTALNGGTACMTECGVGPGPDRTVPTRYEHLLDSCTALCQGDLTCATPAGGGDGICTKPCGTSFDCEDLDGLKGVDTWICSDEVAGGQACVPFGWP